PERVRRARRPSNEASPSRVRTARARRQPRPRGREEARASTAGPLGRGRDAGPSYRPFCPIPAPEPSRVGPLAALGASGGRAPVGALPDAGTAARTPPELSASAVRASATDPDEERWTATSLRSMSGL